MTREHGPITSYAADTAPPVLLVAAAATAGDALAAIDLAGARALDRIDWSEAGTAIGRYAARAVLLVEAEGVGDDLLAAALPAIGAVAAARDLPVIVTLADTQIDLVSAQVMGGNVHLLCAASVADRIVALTVATRAAAAMVLHDTWRESETARLRRLHTEVARIAEILTQLARDESRPGADGDVADRRRGYDPGPGEGGEIAAHEVRHAIRARRLRDQFFGEGLFEDPAWDMLLDLYAAELERVKVSVSSLCIAAAVAPTTALRWIAKLTDGGLLVRHPDPVDRRRAFMTLAPRTSEAMRGYMLAVQRAGAAVA